MLRNNLISLLAEKDNNTVTVKVGDLLIDVEGLADERECIALILNPDDLRDAVQRIGAPPASTRHQQPPPVA